MKNSIFLQPLIFIPIFAFSLFGCNDSTKHSHAQDTQLSQPQNTTNNETDNLPCTSDNCNEETESLQEINEYKAKYYMHVQKWEKFWKEEYNDTKDHALYQDQQNNESQGLDSIFMALRAKYKDNHNALKELEQLKCLLPDCSAIIENGMHLYPHKSILETYKTIKSDKNTQVFSDLQIIEEYDYVLTNKQTTSIDLQSQHAITKQDILSPYRTLKFVWDDYDRLTITLIPKEEICQPYHYNSITTFIQEPRGTITKRYEEKLPTFSYPTDLVAFVAKSCECAQNLNQEKNNQTIDREEKQDAFKKEQMQKNKSEDMEYCKKIHEERKKLWDKYIQDFRVIGILQQEQNLYQTQN